MATTDNKFRSIAAVLGIGSLALVGVTACDDSADDGGDDVIENGGDEGVDDGLDDGAEEDPMDGEGDDDEDL